MEKEPKCFEQYGVMKMLVGKVQGEYGIYRPRPGYSRDGHGEEAWKRKRGKGGHIRHRVKVRSIGTADGLEAELVTEMRNSARNHNLISEASKSNELRKESTRYLEKKGRNEADINLLQTLPPVGVVYGFNSFMMVVNICNHCIYQPLDSLHDTSSVLRIDAYGARTWFRTVLNVVYLIRFHHPRYHFLVNTQS